MAKAKSKKTTTKTTISVKDMVDTMLNIVESQGDLKANVKFTKRDITKSIPVDRENIEVKGSFMLHLPMVCAPSTEIMNAINKIGEKPLLIWRAETADGRETMTMVVAHPENKDVTVIGISDIPQAGQIACIMNSGEDMEIWKDHVKAYIGTPQVKKHNSSHLPVAHIAK